jgi:hypothetical protein
MMTQTKPIGAVLWSAAASLMLALPASGQRLFFEDFNGLPLGPNVEEMSQGQRVWTKTPPSGWTIDDTGMPGYGQPDYDQLDGMREWAGWAFADVKWWPTVDNQRRSEWVRASGAAAIADPDEWDDAPHYVGFFNSYLHTPEIPVAGSPAGALALFFDSSWRPEATDDGAPRFPVGPNGEKINNQTAVITARWDNGPEVEILRWDSIPDSPTFKGHWPNDAVILGLNNPAGAQKLRLKFGLIEAANDWWWAIDNVTVGQPPMLTAVIGRGDGFTARIVEGLGKKVVDGSVSARLDGQPVSITTDRPMNEFEPPLEEVELAHSRAPQIFPPDSVHQVEVSYRTSDGRSVTETATFVAPGYTTVRATPFQLTATITEPDYFQVDESKGVRLELNGTAITASSVTRVDPNQWVLRYQFPAPPPSASAHTLKVSFTTTAAQVVEQTLAFTIPVYPTIPAALATALGTGREAGMRWRTHQLPSARPLGNSIAGAEAQLRGDYGETIHDPSFQTPGGYFVVPWVNFEQSSGSAGNFSVSSLIPGQDVPDDYIPGIPGTTGSDNHIAAEARTFIEFPAAGVYGMVVNSDDGFQVSTGNADNPTWLVLGKFDGGRGAADTEFFFKIEQAGVYFFRLLWFEGTGGASVEWFTINAAGQRALVNGAQTGALKSWQVRSVPEPALPQPTPTIAIAREATGTVIRYTGTLQVANSVEGPYSDVAGASSPYTIPAEGPASRFYRARN